MSTSIWFTKTEQRGHWKTKQINNSGELIQMIILKEKQHFQLIHKNNEADLHYNRVLRPKKEIEGI